MRKAQPLPTRKRPIPVPDDPPVKASDPADDEPAIQRLTVPLSADGSIDTSRLRERTKESLKRALADPKLAESLGSTATVNADDAAFAAMITDAVYDGLSVLSIMMARRAGYTTQQARVLAFTADEKSALQAPTSKVITKHLPDLGGKYRDELLLAFALANIIGAKIVLLRSTGSEVAPTAGQTSETADIA
jgi:hypothetical protein